MSAGEKNKTEHHNRGIKNVAVGIKVPPATLIALDIMCAKSKRKRGDIIVESLEKFIREQNDVEQK